MQKQKLDIAMPLEKLYVIEDEYVREETTCSICKGKGTVEIEGKEFSCPNHCSQGVIYGRHLNRWYLPKTTKTVKGEKVDSYVKRTIERVEIDTYTSNFKKYLRIGYHFKLPGSTYLDWKPSKNCFRTIEEALAECERRNKELEKEKEKNK